jgi:hypothetical protein
MENTILTLFFENLLNALHQACRQVVVVCMTIASGLRALLYENSDVDSGGWEPGFIK